MMWVFIYISQINTLTCLPWVILNTLGVNTSWSELSFAQKKKSYPFGHKLSFTHQGFVSSLHELTFIHYKLMPRHAHHELYYTCQRLMPLLSELYFTYRMSTSRSIWHKLCFTHYWLLLECELYFKHQGLVCLWSKLLSIHR